METKKKGMGLRNLGAGLVWSTRSFSLSANCMLLGFLTFFCTNTLGLDPGVLGVMLLVAKVCDAISNFVVAYFIDNCHFKMGKGRPFELCIIPMWILTFILFGIPMGWQTVVQYAVVFLLYVSIVSIFQTTLYCTEPIYFNHAYKDEARRVSVQSVNGIVNVLTFSLVGIILPLLMGKYLMVENGWLIMSLIIGVPCIVLGMIRFVCVREVDIAVTAAQTERITISDTIKGLFSNKYVVIIAALYFVVNLTGTFTNTSGTYYFQYIVGNIELMSVLNSLSFVSIFAIPLFAMLSKKFSKTQLIIATMVLGVVGNVIKFAAGKNMILLIAGSLIAGMVTYPIAIFGNLMLIDCMDFGEWKNGKRVEGAIFAGSSLGSTLGSGVGSAIFGGILSLFGYDGTAAVQTASAIFGIKMTFSILPLIFFALAGVMMRFYNLDKKMPQIHQELDERHKKIAASETAE